MKAIKNNVIKYFKNLGKTYPFLDMLQIVLVASMILCGVDVFDLFTANLMKLPLELVCFCMPVLVVLFIIYFIKMHIFILFKNSGINILDKAIWSLVFMGAICTFMWKTFLNEYSYKWKASAIILGIALLALVIRIIFVVYIFYKKEMEKLNLYDLKYIYENDINNDDRKSILISEKAVNYDLYKKEKRAINII